MLEGRGGEGKGREQRGRGRRGGEGKGEEGRGGEGEEGRGGEGEGREKGEGGEGRGGEGRTRSTGEQRGGGKERKGRGGEGRGGEGKGRGGGRGGVGKGKGRGGEGEVRGRGEGEGGDSMHGCVHPHTYVMHTHMLTHPPTCSHSQRCWALGSSLPSLQTPHEQLERCQVSSVGPPPASTLERRGDRDGVLVWTHTRARMRTNLYLYYHCQSWLSGCEPAGGNKTGGPIGSRDTSLISPIAWPPQCSRGTHLWACNTHEMREVGYGLE